MEKADILEMTQNFLQSVLFQPGFTKFLQNCSKLQHSPITSTFADSSMEDLNTSCSSNDNPSSINSCDSVPQVGSSQTSKIPDKNDLNNKIFYPFKSRVSKNNLNCDLSATKKKCFHQTYTKISNYSLNEPINFQTSVKIPKTSFHDISLPPKIESKAYQNNIESNKTTPLSSPTPISSQQHLNNNSRIFRPWTNDKES